MGLAPAFALWVVMDYSGVVNHSGGSSLQKQAPFLGKCTCLAKEEPSGTF